MEPPAKRRRTKSDIVDTEEEDELDFEPEALNARRDPAYQLQQGRAKAAIKLKSRFEDIFAKYEKDFTGIGDEIDLRTGEVVVDNGHLQSMRDLNDTGDGEEDDADSSEDEERILHGSNVSQNPMDPSNAAARKDPWHIAGPNSNWPRPTSMMDAPSHMSSMMLPSQPSFMTPPLSFESSNFGSTTSTDTAWQAPELPRPAFLGTSFGVPGRQYSFGMGPTTKKVTPRRPLPALEDQDEEDEDVLLGSSADALKKKESPLIKKRLPSVDVSSDDAGLDKLIQEVIENIPETPHKVKTPKVKRSRGKPPGSGEASYSHSKPEGKGQRGNRQTIGSQNKLSKQGNYGVIAKNARTEADKDPRSKRSSGEGPEAGLQAKKPKAKEAPGAFEDYDLETYRNVTGTDTSMPAGQFLYVQIEAKKINRDDVSIFEDHDYAREEMIAITPADVEESSAHLPASHSGQATVNEGTPGPENHDSSGSKIADPETLAGPKAQQAKEAFERNTVDPMFTFSDEEALPPKRARRGRRKSQPNRPAAETIPHESEQHTQQLHVSLGPFERNVVDPSYAFSDEEELPTKKAKSKRNLQPAVLAGVGGQEVSSAGPEPDENPVSKSKTMREAPSGRKEKRRSLNLSRPEKAVKRTQNQPQAYGSTTAPSSEHGREETLSAANASVSRWASREQKDEEEVADRSSLRDVQLTKQEPKETVPEAQPRSWGQRRNQLAAEQSSLQNTRSTEQEVQEIVPETRIENNERILGRKEPALQTANNEIQEPTSAKNEMHKIVSSFNQKLRERDASSQSDTDMHPRTSRQSRGQNKNERIASSELGDSFTTTTALAATGSAVDGPGPKPAAAATSPVQQPSTPHPKKTPSSKLELISLLSDNEDEEDEISFNLADFTPSGHHRILVHRPGSAASTSRGVSTTTKKHRASLLFGSASSRRFKVQTPGSASARASGHTKKKRRRRSSTSLARSVVKVRRESRAPSPTGSIVQTPGGTRRRCGEAGFRCEKDFCFVCISI